MIYKVNEGLIIYDFNTLPLLRVYLSWPTVQTLMIGRVLLHLIWVYAVCICSLFEFIQPVQQERTLNFRLGMSLAIKWVTSACEILSVV